MDDKLDKLTRSLDDLKRTITAMQTKLDQIAKDVGTQDSRNLSDIIYKMDGYMSRDVTDVQTMLRETQDTRRMVTSIELMAKEMMKGMSIIYNSVDELEEGLLPERLTK
jgi:hypothetical protein